MQDCKSKKILNEFLTLSTPIRAIAGQVAIQAHLLWYDFPTMAAFIKSSGYDPDIMHKHKYKNFWYKLRRGRALTQKSTMLYFLNSVGRYSTLLINHSLWHLIDNTRGIGSVVASLPQEIQKVILRKDHNSPYNNESPFYHFKQSYKQQRYSLYGLHSLDSFAALLLIAKLQVEKLNHHRPTSAEQLAYAQFLYLFGYQYPVCKKWELGHQINQFLSPSEITSSKDNLSLVYVSDFKSVEELVTIGTEINKWRLYKFMSQHIQALIVNNPNHPCFTTY